MNKQTPWWSSDSRVPTATITKPSLRSRMPGYLSAVAAVAIVFIAAFANATPAQTRQLPDGGIEKAPSLPALAATCGGISHWEPSKSVGWRNKFDSYIWKQAPPLSGDFAKAPITDLKLVSSFDDFAAVVASLYRGKIVIWYDPTNKMSQEVFVKKLAAQFGGQVYVLPWPTEFKDWWPGRSIILTAWGTSQSCGQPSYEVLRRFIEETKDLAPGRKYSASEPGPRSNNTK